jgi:hypothetical protein
MSEGLRLAQLIAIAPADVERALAEQAKDETAVALVQKQLAGYPASLGAEELNRALDVDLLTLLAPAWGKLEAVRDAARRASPASERTVVTLGPHELTSVQHPVLTLTMAQVPLPELRLTVELLARFKSVALGIAGAVIRGASPGESSVSARLLYNGVQLKEAARPQWALPPRVAFDDGIAIAS